MNRGKVKCYWRWCGWCGFMQCAASSVLSLSVWRASERTHLDSEERDGGRPLLALPLGFSGAKARDPRVPWPLPIVTTDPAL